MGLFDKAKDAMQNVDKAKELVDEHGDKLPGDLGEKAKDLVDKADELSDKIPGADGGEEA